MTSTKNVKREILKKNLQTILKCRLLYTAGMNRAVINIEQASEMAIGLSYLRNSDASLLYAMRQV